MCFLAGVANCCPSTVRRDFTFRHDSPTWLQWLNWLVRGFNPPPPPDLGGGRGPRCWLAALYENFATAARWGTGVTDMALAVPPERLPSSCRQARSTASRSEVTGLSDSWRDWMDRMSPCWNKVTENAAQGVHPWVCRSTAGTKRLVTVRKRNM